VPGLARQHADVDAELERYLHALENFVQGTVLWYYLSPSEYRWHCFLDSKLDMVCFTGYFRGVDVTNRENLVVPLFEKGAF